jgi:hypothetical protein
MARSDIDAEKLAVELFAVGSVLPNVKIMIDDILKENENLKKEVKTLQWRLHEQD